MSRVRILNLPKDCTEEQLRQHIVRSAPSNAPSLNITDVRILRKDHSGSRQQLEQSQRHRGGPTGGVRMAFVGFHSAAAGHYVVDYFNNTYFRSSKIVVEVARGLNDIGVTLNMRKKLEKLGGAGLATGQRAAGATAAKRPRDVEGNEAAVSAEGEGGSGRKNSRRELFIDERTRATDGPSWAAEVLVPHAAGGTDPSSPSPGSSSQSPHTNADASGHDDGLGGESAHAAVRLEEAAEALEHEALAKQQALGEVDDMAFLSMIGGQGQDKERCGSDQGESVADEGENSEQQQRQRMECQEDTQAETPEAEEAAALDIARESRRVRLGNIPYIATEEHIKQFAASLVGPVEAVHVPLTKDTRQSKGAAFVTFVHPDDAVRALALCHGAILMGRLLRVSAAVVDPHGKRVLAREARWATTALGDLAGFSEFKQKKELERRQTHEKDSSSSHINWSTMYMNSSAAVDTMAQRLGVKSADVVGVHVKGAAVRAAIAEAYLTTEVQHVLSDEGIAMDVLDSGQLNLLKPRSNTTILVKNLQLKFPEEAAELSKLFARYGALETSAFPSAGTFALFRYTHPQDARVAFTRLAYKLFKNSPLFLEWAPVGVIVEDSEGSSPTAETGISSGGGEAGDGEDTAVAAKTAVFTLFITNIPFNVSEDDLYAFLLDNCPRLARAPEKLIQRLVVQKEQGRAFLTLSDQATLAYCQTRINGKSFNGRVLACVVSKQTAAAMAPHGKAPTAAAVGEEEDGEVTKASAVMAHTLGRQRGGGASGKVPPGCDPLKIIIKNLPFEATEKDVRELVSAFSEVRSVRLPRKNHSFTSHRENNHRGFAFVEFMSEAEAARALDVLKATHLYGRHLVLQYASLDG